MNVCHGAMMLAIAAMLIGPGTKFEVQSLLDGAANASAVRGFSR
jgi:hypothetical protein